MTAPDVLPLLDMSSLPGDWARKRRALLGDGALCEAEMVAPKTREAYPGEDLFPAFTVEFLEP
ncbi:MAG: hypothetical protein R2724_13500 [Bryobacterales bacterium]